MRKVGPEGTAFALVLAGGVFRHPGVALAEAITARVHTTSPAARPIRSPWEPVAGVAAEALMAADVAIGPDVLQRIGATLPADIFHAPVQA